MILEQYRKWIAKSLSLTGHMILRDLQSFSAMIGDAGLTIDVGSGYELHYKEIFRSSRIIGLDLYQPSHVQGDASALPFQSLCIDTVICTEVLEHLEDAHTALGEIHRILVQDGYLIVTVPFLLGIHDLVDYHRWTETGLRSLLDGAGFTVISFRKRGGVFSVVGNMISHIPRQLFGKSIQRRSWIFKGLYFFFLLPFLVVPWVMCPFDALDRQKHFVVGYSALCQKR